MALASGAQTVSPFPPGGTAGGPPGAGQPVTNDDVFLLSTTNKTAYFDTTSNQDYHFFYVDATGGATFTILQSANALSTLSEQISIYGKAQFVQTGGTHTTYFLDLAGYPGSSGTYTLQSGILNTLNKQTIGIGGTGLFNQTGGSNTIDNVLYLGGNTGGVGTYNLNGGHLQADEERIGENGTGIVNQLPNSTNLINTKLTLGYNSGSSGTYNMKGGYLQVSNEFVGSEFSVGGTGKGAFIQSGGTHTISDTLTVGDSSSGNTFNLKGGDLSANNEVIARFGGGQFTQGGGTNTVLDTISIGDNDIGAYTLNGGKLQTVNETIGRKGTGTFTQNGGTHTVSGTLVLGDEFSFSKGTYNLNQGSLQAGNEVIGSEGTGTFTQAGGTHTANQLILGDLSTGSGTGNGTYNLKQGSLKVTGNEFIGNFGIGTFNQIGGTHTVTMTLALADNGGSSGTYNLQGGTLSAKNINIFPGGTFNVKNVTTTVTGDVTNLGTIKTTNAKVTWNGNFTNNVAYISDPSTQTFNKDLVVGAGGYLVGGSQDLFVIKNDFINQSANQDQWNTVLSSLQFATGADNIHVFYIDGQGATVVNNFAWYSLNITGQTLRLKDGNGTPNGDQWLMALTGAKFTGMTLTNIFNDDPTNVLNLYYDKNLAANAYLHGLNYTITGGAGGMLIAHTPVPPSVLLLGSGLLGLGALGWRRRRG